MRKTTFLTGTIMLFAASLLFLGCPSTVQPEREEVPGTGFVSLEIGHSRMRTIMPDYDITDFDTFSFTFTATGTNLAAPVADTVDVPTGTFELVTGTWELEVTALIGTAEVARSETIPVTVTPGTTAPVPVTLYPITGPGADYGTFSWNITIPAGVGSASMTLTPITGPGAPIVITLAPPLTGGTILGYDDEIPPNRYRLVLSLTNTDSETATINEVLHIYQNLSSIFNIPITDGHFPTTLLRRIGRSWEAPIWNFDTGLTYAHFGAPGLGLFGLTSGNFIAVRDRFSALSNAAARANNFYYVDGDTDRLGALIDAALIANWGATPVAAPANRYYAEDAITALIANGNIPTFQWTSETALTVTIEDYTVSITFADAVPRVLSGTVAITVPNPFPNPLTILTANLTNLTISHPTSTGNATVYWTVSWFRDEPTGTPVFTAAPAPTLTTTESTFTVTNPDDFNRTIYVVVSSPQLAGSVYAYFDMPNTRTFNLTFADFVDRADVNVTAPATLEPISVIAPVARPVIVTAPDATAMRWFFGAVGADGQPGTPRGTGTTSLSFTVDSALHGNQIGTYLITVELDKGGSTYSRHIEFTVEW